MSQSALTYTTLATRAADGALVSGLTVQNFPHYVADPAARINLVNKAIVSVESNLPEGTRCEMVIDNLRDPLENSFAGQMAQSLQEQYLYGALRDPGTGEVMKSWPEYPSQIAWANDSTATITMRWVKGQPFAWILVGVAIAIMGIVLYDTLTKSGYGMSSATTGTGLIGIGAGGLEILGIPVWPYWVVGGAAIAATPAAIGYYGKVQRSRAQALEADEELEEAESHTGRKRGGF